MKAYVIWPFLAFVPGTLLYVFLCSVLAECKPEGLPIVLTILGFFAAGLAILGVVFERQRKKDLDFIRSRYAAAPRQEEK